MLLYIILFARMLLTWKFVAYHGFQLFSHTLPPEEEEEEALLFFFYSVDSLFPFSILFTELTHHFTQLSTGNACKSLTPGCVWFNPHKHGLFLCKESKFGVILGIGARGHWGEVGNHPGLLTSVSCPPSWSCQDWHSQDTPSEAISNPSLSPCLCMESDSKG